MSRRSKKRRTTKTTILVVTNGEVTEHRYLEWLRDRVNGPQEKYSVKVEALSGDPSWILSKVETANYDDVWLVVDQDDHHRSKMQKFMKDCRDKGAVAVVNVPCFEVWLNAHYERVIKYQNQKDAQRHYQRLTNLPDRAVKNIPDNFPFEDYEKACGNAHLVGSKNPKPNELAPSPATPMPYLLHALGLIEPDVAQG